jgi:hypothetical protein
MQQENEAQDDSGSWPEQYWEVDCGGCSSLRVQMSAMSSNQAFEFETLSQHRFLLVNSWTKATPSAARLKSTA